MSGARPLLVYGLHATLGVLRHAPADVIELWVRERAEGESAELARVLELAAAHGVSVQRVTQIALERLTGGAPHQGVALKRRPPSLWSLDDFLALTPRRPDPRLLIALDQVQDPHNFGAVLRVADAAGADGVITTRDRSAGLSPVVAKVASGALDTVPIIAVTNLVRALGELKDAGLWIVGATHDAADDLYAVNLVGPVVWVLGGEGRGLRRLTREACDWLARIPMRGSVGSLNLGTAAAVCLYETVRQRLAAGA